MSQYFYHGMHYPDGHNAATCEYCSYEKKSEIESLRTALAASQERVRVLTEENAKMSEAISMSLARADEEHNSDRPIHLPHFILNDIKLWLDSALSTPPAPSPAKPDAGKPCEACGSTNDEHNADDHKDFNQTWSAADGRRV